MTSIELINILEKQIKKEYSKKCFRRKDALAFLALVKAKLEVCTKTGEDI